MDEYGLISETIGSSKTDIEYTDIETITIRAVQRERLSGTLLLAIETISHRENNHAKCSHKMHHMVEMKVALRLPQCERSVSGVQGLHCDQILGWENRWFYSVAVCTMADHELFTQALWKQI